MLDLQFPCFAAECALGVLIKCISYSFTNFANIRVCSVWKYITLFLVFSLIFNILQKACLTSTDLSRTCLCNISAKKKGNYFLTKIKLVLTVRFLIRLRFKMFIAIIFTKIRCTFSTVLQKKIIIVKKVFVIC